jgi:hypothetical protein
MYYSQLWFFAPHCFFSLLPHMLGKHTIPAFIKGLPIRNKESTGAFRAAG